MMALEYGKTLKLNAPKMEMESDVLRVTEKIHCEAVQRLDDAICCEIIEIAKEAGVTQLILLDKEAITSALKKGMPMEPLDDGWLYCPVCHRDVLMDKPKYCPDCGQALDWGEDDG